MKRWMSSAAGAVRMGLVWAVAWAVVAVGVGLIVDPDGSMDEMWPAIGAYPGFLSGMVTYLLLRTRGRELASAAPLDAAGTGALAGMLVGVVPFTIGEPTGTLPLWQLFAGVLAAFALLSAASAAAFVAVAARRTSPRTA